MNYASALNLTAHPTEAEQKLQAAEAALEEATQDEKTNNILGHIAAVRAMMAVGQHHLESNGLENDQVVDFSQLN